jgi:hypothetical protein
MMVGAVIVSACLLVLGFTREIVGALMGGDGVGDDGTRRLTIVVAVAAIYAVDFAINASESRLLDCLVACGLFADGWTLSIYSHVVCEESDCRHAADGEAACWCCLG